MIFVSEDPSQSEKDRATFISSIPEVQAMLDDCESELTGAAGSIAATKAVSNSALLAGRRLNQQGFDRPTQGPSVEVKSIGTLKGKRNDKEAESRKRKAED